MKTKKHLSPTESLGFSVTKPGRKDQDSAAGYTTSAATPCRQSLDARPSPATSQERKDNDSGSVQQTRTVVVPFHLNLLDYSTKTSILIVMSSDCASERFGIFVNRYSTLRAQQVLRAMARHNSPRRYAASRNGVHLCLRLANLPLMARARVSASKLFPKPA